MKIFGYKPNPVLTVSISTLIIAFLIYSAWSFFVLSATDYALENEARRFPRYPNAYKWEYDITNPNSVRDEIIRIEHEPRNNAYICFDTEDGYETVFSYYKKELNALEYKTKETENDYTFVANLDPEYARDDPRYYFFNYWKPGFAGTVGVSHGYHECDYYIALYIYDSSIEPGIRDNYVRRWVDYY